MIEFNSISGDDYEVVTKTLLQYFLSNDKMSKLSINIKRKENYTSHPANSTPNSGENPDGIQMTIQLKD
jgi:hypothetical protein